MSLPNPPALRPAIVGLVVVLVAAHARSQTIETFAGGGTFVDAPALDVPAAPNSVAIGPDGHVYAGTFDRLIRFDPATSTATALPGLPGAPEYSLGSTSVALDPAGELHIVLGSSIYRFDLTTGGLELIAGNGSYGSSGNWGPATSASFQQIGHIAFDAMGNLYIPDSFDNSVRMVDTSGIVRPIAGANRPGDFYGDGGPALGAGLSWPQSVAVDAGGNVLIADSGNNRVRRISALDGTIETVAGTGAWWGYNGDGIPALEANLSQPTTLAVDASGNLFVNEQGGARIRRVAADTGLITTVAGNGNWGFTGDGGPATAAEFSWVTGIAVDADGDLYIGDEGNSRLRRVAGDTGIIASVLGNGMRGFCGEGAPALDTCLYGPLDVAVDGDGNVLISDSSNGRIRKVSASSGLVTTVAGTGNTSDDSGDGGPAVEAGFYALPRGLALDNAGNLLITTYTRVRRVDAATGIITTVAGTSNAGFSGDGGPATAAALQEPSDVIIDGAGNVYIVDTGNHRIRRVDAVTGIITTVAGSGLATGALGDGGPATSASLNRPQSIALDEAGNLLIADYYHFRVRRVDAATGVITTIAGNGATSASGDGGPASAAGLGAPAGIVLDDAGHLYLTSTGQVRRIDAATGIITTVVSDINGPYDERGRSVAYPFGLDVDDAGHLYVADLGPSLVWRIGLPVTPPGDDTPPTIQANLSGVEGFNGWFTSNVMLTWSVLDAESGVTSSVGCDSTTVTADTAGQYFSCTAVSDGGVASSTVIVKRDATPPVLTFGAPTPAANEAGWHNTNVTVPFTYTDATSGPFAVDAVDPLIISREGIGVSRTLTVWDQAGNSASFTTPAFDIDKTPPSLVFGAPSPAANAAGWHNGDVSIAFETTDALSGMASSSVPSPLVVSTEGTAVSGTVTATDLAGNTTTVGSPAVAIDKTRPTIDFASPAQSLTYRFYSDLAAQYSCTDGVSGVASCVAPTPSGDELDTTVPGNYSLEVTATDAAGNTATEAHAYTVGATFTFEGFLTPMRSPPILNVVPRGSTVPIKWRLPDGRGGYVSDPASFVSLTVQSLSCVGTRVPLNDPATGAPGLNHNAQTGTFVYNWVTNPSWTGCRRVRIGLRDGSVRELRFRFQ